MDGVSHAEKVREVRILANQKVSRLPITRALSVVLAPFLLAACGDTNADGGLSPAEVEEIVRFEIGAAPPPPTPSPGLTSKHVHRMVEEAMALMPQPTRRLTAAAVAESVRRAMDEMPQPEEGLSRREVEGIVRDAIAAIPEPQPGLTMPEVEDAIRTALAELPQPEPRMTRSEAELLRRFMWLQVPPTRSSHLTTARSSRC